MPAPMQRLDPVVTDHPHWASFTEEDARTTRLLSKIAALGAKAEQGRREWEAATAVYEAEVLAAELEDREPDPAIEDPGEYVAPKALLGRRPAYEIAQERDEQVTAMRRLWARNQCGELLPKLDARDHDLLAQARATLREMNRHVRDLIVARETRDWLRAAKNDHGEAADVPLAPALREVQNLSKALADALNRAQLGEAPNEMGETRRQPEIVYRVSRA